MKQLLVVCMLILAVTFSAQAQQDKSPKSKGKEAAAKKKGPWETVTIKTSAKCEMCKTALEKSMGFAKGVKSSSLDVNSKVLTVRYNSKKTSPEAIRKAVSETGYDADQVQADKAAYDRLPDCCKKDGKM